MTSLQWISLWQTGTAVTTLLYLLLKFSNINLTVFSVHLLAVLSSTSAGRQRRKVHCWPFFLPFPPSSSPFPSPYCSLCLFFLFLFLILHFPISSSFLLPLSSSSSLSSLLILLLLQTPCIHTGTVNPFLSSLVLLDFVYTLVSASLSSPVSPCFVYILC